MIFTAGVAGSGAEGTAGQISMPVTVDMAPGSDIGVVLLLVIHPPPVGR